MLPGARTVRQLPVFLVANNPRDGLAGLLETREAPAVRKLPALLRLDRLDPAIDPVEKNALAIRFLRQRQPKPEPPQLRVLVDEIPFVEAQQNRQAGDVLFRQSHLARPAATRRAALTFVMDRHVQPFSNASICAMSAAVRFQSPAPTISSICDGFRVPTIAPVTSGRRSTHAIAN